MHKTERALCLLRRVAGDASPFAIEFSGHEDDKDEVSNPDEDEPSVLLDLRSPELFVYCLTVINFMLLIASTLAQRTIKEVNLVGSGKVHSVFCNILVSYISWAVHLVAPSHFTLSA